MIGVGYTVGFEFTNGLTGAALAVLLLLVKVNPITLVTDPVRALALGEPFELFPSLGWAALAMAVVLAVFVPLAVRRYRPT